MGKTVLKKEDKKWKKITCQTQIMSLKGLQEIPPKCYLEPTEMHTRDPEIFNTYWVDFPKEIINFSNLKVLDLWHTVSTMPKEIGQLTQLHTLIAARGAIKEIPKEIGKLEQLETLDLFYNQIKELPKEIGNLTNLRTLNLSLNQLSTLPAEIGNLIKLKELRLEMDRLKSIPKEIGNLADLEILDLRANTDLTELPEELSQLSKLRYLYLDGTKVERLPLPLCKTMHALNTYTDKMFYGLCEKWMK